MDAGSALRALDESVQKRRGRKVLEDVRNLSIYDRHPDALPSITSALLQLAPSEIESEENKGIRVCYEYFYCSAAMGDSFRFPSPLLRRFLSDSSEMRYPARAASCLQLLSFYLGAAASSSSSVAACSGSAELWGSTLGLLAAGLKITTLAMRGIHGEGGSQLAFTSKATLQAKKLQALRAYNAPSLYSAVATLLTNPLLAVVASASSSVSASSFRSAQYNASAQILQLDSLEKMQNMSLSTVLASLDVLDDLISSFGYVLASSTCSNDLSRGVLHTAATVLLLASDARASAQRHEQQGVKSSTPSQSSPPGAAAAMPSGEVRNICYLQLGGVIPSSLADAYSSHAAMTAAVSSVAASSPLTPRSNRIGDVFPSSASFDDRLVSFLYSSSISTSLPFVLPSTATSLRGASSTAAMAGGGGGGAASMHGGGTSSSAGINAPIAFLHPYIVDILSASDSEKAQSPFFSEFGTSSSYQYYGSVRKAGAVSGGEADMILSGNVATGRRLSVIGATSMASSLGAPMSPPPKVASSSGGGGGWFSGFFKSSAPESPLSPSGSTSLSSSVNGNAARPYCPDSAQKLVSMASSLAIGARNTRDIMSASSVAWVSSRTVAAAASSSATSDSFPGTLPPPPAFLQLRAKKSDPAAAVAAVPLSTKNTSTAVPLRGGGGSTLLSKAPSAQSSLVGSRGTGSSSLTASAPTPPSSSSSLASSSSSTLLDLDDIFGASSVPVKTKIAGHSSMSHPAPSTSSASTIFDAGSFGLLSLSPATQEVVQVSNPSVAAGYALLVGIIISGEDGAALRAIQSVVGGGLGRFIILWPKIAPLVHLPPPALRGRECHIDAVFDAIFLRIRTCYERATASTSSGASYYGNAPLLSRVLRTAAHLGIAVSNFEATCLRFIRAELFREQQAFKQSHGQQQQNARGVKREGRVPVFADTAKFPVTAAPGFSAPSAVLGGLDAVLGSIASSLPAPSLQPPSSPTPASSASTLRSLLSEGSGGASSSWAHTAVEFFIRDFSSSESERKNEGRGIDTSRTKKDRLRGFLFRIARRCVVSLPALFEVSHQSLLWSRSRGSSFQHIATLALQAAICTCPGLSLVAWGKGSAALLASVDECMRGSRFSDDDNGSRYGYDFMDITTQLRAPSPEQDRRGSAQQTWSGGHLSHLYQSTAGVTLRSTGLAFLRLYCSAPTEFSAETVKDMTAALLSKVKLYASTLPPISRLFPCIIDSWKCAAAPTRNGYQMPCLTDGYLTALQGSSFVYPLRLLRERGGKPENAALLGGQMNHAGGATSSFSDAVAMALEAQFHILSQLHADATAEPFSPSASILAATATGREALQMMRLSAMTGAVDSASAVAFLGGNSVCALAGTRSAMPDQATVDLIIHSFLVDETSRDSERFRRLGESRGALELAQIQRSPTTSLTAAAARMIQESLRSSMSNLGDLRSGSNTASTNTSTGLLKKLARSHNSGVLRGPLHGPLSASPQSAALPLLRYVTIAGWTLDSSLGLFPPSTIDNDSPSSSSSSSSSTSSSSSSSSSSAGGAIVAAAAATAAASARVGFKGPPPLEWYQYVHTAVESGWLPQELLSLKGGLRTHPINTPPPPPSIMDEDEIGDSEKIACQKTMMRLFRRVVAFQMAKSVISTSSLCSQSAL